ncbi:ABC transporter ATP-binding protein [Gammaproteobacteria bacterium]|nr:ABC transporter ATP-binding protein [Gammaproteobacteria bacterium]
MASIHLSGLAHRYAPTAAGEQSPYALQPLDQLWEDGGAYALLGPSGCGKTTLLNIISGLVRPSEGRVLFDGEDVTDLRTEERNIAQVFQFPVIYDTLSVEDNLAFPLRNRGLDEAVVAKRVAETLAMLGLESRAKERARSLSADDKQKISLGRGLVRTDVRAILFDEPLTVIDPHLKWQLRTELKKIHQRFGHTMIYVTHDQTEALTFADKVVVMDAGVILQVGTPKELFDRPRHTFVGTFIGSPGMNVFECRFDGMVALIGEQAIALDALTQDSARAQKLESAAANGVKLELGIRPEALTLSADASTGIPAELVAVEDLGRHSLVRLKIEGQPLCVLIDEGESVPKEVYVRFDPASTLLYADSLLVESGATQVEGEL